MDLELSVEQRDIVELFSSLAERFCPLATLREHEDLGFSTELWEQLVTVGAPGMAVSEERGGGGGTLLDLALVAEALGARLAPVPFVEHAVTARLLERVGTIGSDAFGAIVGGDAIATLALQPAIDGRARLVPAGAIADAVLVLDGDELALVRSSPPGVAVPNLASAPLADRAVHASSGVERNVLAQGDEARALYDAAVDEWRALTASALVGVGIGALAIGTTYVTERHQFGVPIGSFQAIQHALADVSVALDGAQLLARKAAWALDTERPDAVDLAAMALLFCAEHAQRATERALHFHGGYGFMQEYDIQLHYRRAKGWPLVLASPARECARLAARRYGPLVPVERADMDFAPSVAVVRFRAEVRDLIAEHFTDEVRDEVHETGTIHSWPLHRAIGERGWIREALPEAQGGGGRDPEELAGLFAELELAGAPYDGLSNVVMVSSVLAHVGNEMIKHDVLPRLLSGDAVVCLGYTEPDSGSDVAAARTRAVRDGEGWRIDGQKMFTSVAEESDWIFLLTRTTTEGAKHAGLTFFLVPMDTPGITLQEVRTLPGKRVNITFLDDVRVGDEWRVGDIDGGWQVMLVALSFERGLAGGVRDGERLLRVVEELAQRDAGDGEPRVIDDAVARERLVRLAIDNEVADLLTGRAAWVAASGRLPGTEGAAARLFASESFTRAASWAIDLAGPEGVVRAADRAGQIDGFFERCYRLAPGTTLAGGTTEIQRNLVAQRGLGLPRGR